MLRDRVDSFLCLRATHLHESPRPKVWYGPALDPRFTHSFASGAVSGVPRSGWVVAEVACNIDPRRVKGVPDCLHGFRTERTPGHNLLTPHRRLTYSPARAWIIRALF